MRMNTRDIFGLAVLLVLCFGAAWLGSQFTTPSIPNWYAALRKPSWNPPNWVFAPVWSALYLSMAIAAWLVWRMHGFAGAKIALALFAIQLGLNIFWSFLFFTAHRPGLAFGEIILLWFLIAATLVAFFPLSRIAAWLLAPYLLWVGFAAALNFSIWRLNA